MNDVLLTAIYGRVSSQNQENEGTIETQLSAVREFAQKNNLMIVKEYTDEGWSGDSIERPSLDQLRMDARKKIWQAVLIYDPDRLARRYSYQELITDELREKGIEIIYVTTPAPKNGIEKILFGVQGLFAEYERAKIAERFRLGKVRKAKEGNIILSEGPYGYRFIPKSGKKGEAGFRHGYIEVDSAESEVVRQVFEWVGNENFTIRRVVRELQKRDTAPRKSKRGVWSTSTLSTMLRNRTYIGEAHYGASVAVVPDKPLKPAEYRKVKKTSRRIKPVSERIKIPVPGIINEQLFEKVQVQLKRNYELSNRNRKNHYLLAGKIWCNCGRRRTGEGTGKNLYYRCTDRIYSFPLPPACLEAGIRAVQSDTLVWEKLTGLMTDPVLLKDKLAQWVDLKQQKMNDFIIDNTETEKTIGKLREQEDRYIKAYGLGVLTLEQFEKQALPIRSRIAALRQQLAEFEKKDQHVIMPVLPDENALNAFVARAQSYVHKIGYAGKKKIADDLIHKVTGNRQSLSVCGAIPLSYHLNYESLCSGNRNSQVTIRHLPRPLHKSEMFIPFEFEISLEAGG